MITRGLFFSAVGRRSRGGIRRRSGSGWSMQIDRLRIGASPDVDEVEHEEDPEKQKAREADDRVDRPVMPQVHEEQRDDGAFDGGNRQRNHDVTRAELNVRRAHGDDSKDQERHQSDNVNSRLRLWILCVFSMRAHVIR